MKAWKCSTFDDIEGELAVIVWAEGRGKAKSFVVGDERLGDPDFTWIHCRRASWADELQGLTEDELEIEEIKQGWTWNLPEGEVVDADALPLIQKYGGTLNKFYAAYENPHTPLRYGEDGFYEER